MDVVILLVLISLALVLAGLIFFVIRLRDGDFEHGDRLALAPLLDDGVTTEQRAPAGPPGGPIGSSLHEESEGGNQHGIR